MFEFAFELRIFQFAMQLMHHAGIKNIVGTCSTETKENFLKSIGATDVINFTKIKNLGITFDDEVKRLCSNGINIAYESIGGEVLDTVIDNIGKAIIYNIPIFERHCQYIEARSAAIFFLREPQGNIASTA